jgi:neutral ceramidase
VRAPRPRRRRPRRRLRLRLRLRLRSGSAKNMSGWRAGVAKVCITPDEPICLDGWGSRISQGVSMDIWAKAAALAVGADGPVHVLVSADLCGFSGSMAERLVAWAAAEHGMDRSQLVLNCSHNHSGPVFLDTLPLYHDLPDAEYDVIAKYTATLEQRVRQAISDAIGALAPARVGWGQSLCGFAVNRRRSRGNETRELPTVVDQDVPVLTLRCAAAAESGGGGGALIGCLFGYSCHATAINDQKVNGDYCGHACAAIERAHPGTVALFVAGCGADCNPLPRLDPEGELGRMYGTILAASVEEVLEAPEEEEAAEHGAGASGVYSAAALAPALESAYGECTLPFELPPTRAELEQGLLGTAEGSAERRQLRYQLDLLDGELNTCCLIHPSARDCHSHSLRRGAHGPMSAVLQTSPPTRCAHPGSSATPSAGGSPPASRTARTSGGWAASCASSRSPASQWWTTLCASSPSSDGPTHGCVQASHIVSPNLSRPREKKLG